MTAPVTQSATDAGFAIQFKMPASYTLESLPEPLTPESSSRRSPEAALR
jgi:hypothetical protein